MSNVLRYPLDVGSLDKGHYMVIHINQQVKTRFKRETTEDLPTILQNQKNTGNSTAISQFGTGVKNGIEDIEKGAGLLGEKISDTMVGKRVAADASAGAAFVSDLSSAGVKDFVSGSLSVVKKVGSAISEVAEEQFKLLGSGNGLRTIERTTDSIAFYMPDTLNFTNNQQYSTMEFGASPLAYLNAAMAGYSQIKDNSEDRVGQVFKNITPFIINSLLRNKFGNAGAGIYAAASGTVINPQMEMIYSSPSFREFRFDFMLYPRSSKEAVEVQKILSRLRFHQAPEIFKEGAAALGGFFLIPPSEFDISFYYNGKINPNIPKISTCVLTSIDTDYAPNGWSAYEVPSNVGQPYLGQTGMPVGIRLSLNFQETEIMTKDNFNNDTFKDDSFDEKVLLGRGNYPTGAI
jgi:hypothetical protein